MAIGNSVKVSLTASSFFIVLEATATAGIDIVVGAACVVVTAPLSPAAALSAPPADSMVAVGVGDSLIALGLVAVVVAALLARDAAAALVTLAGNA